MSSTPFYSWQVKNPTSRRVDALWALPAKNVVYADSCGWQFKEARPVDYVEVEQRQVLCGESFEISNADSITEIGADARVLHSRSYSEFYGQLARQAGAGMFIYLGGSAVRRSEDFVQVTAGISPANAVARMSSQQYAVAIETLSDGVCLTAMPGIYRSSLKADWWKPWADAMAGGRVVYENGGFTYRYTQPAKPQQQFDFFEGMDVLEFIDPSMAQCSQIVNPFSVFIPVVAGCQGWPGECRYWRHQRALPSFRDRVSPVVPPRSLHVPSWDRSLQVRA